MPVFETHKKILKILFNRYEAAAYAGWQLLKGALTRRVLLKLDVRTARGEKKWRNSKRKNSIAAQTLVVEVIIAQTKFIPAK